MILIVVVGIDPGPYSTAQETKRPKDQKDEWVSLKLVCV
jgi:hypothetical protein